MAKEFFFESREALFTALTYDCCTHLSAAVNAGHRASFVVSGGSTPVPLFNALSEIDLGWEAVDVALVDERWVGIDSEFSNERLIKHTLLTKSAATARLIGMKTEHVSAIEAQEEVNKRYRQLAQPFDLVLLGMGSDAHTASLFPRSDTIEYALRSDNKSLCTAVMANKSVVTGAVTERMSLTLSAITQAKHIVLLITGDEKLSVYRQALAALSAVDMPISAVLQQQRCPVTVYWAP